LNRSRPPRPWLLGFAVLITALNAAKPLHIDDNCYYLFARQIAQAPLDPYGFKAFTVNRPEPANEILAPAGLPYWWAAAIALFGERPVLWKLWLLPLVLLWVFALDALCRRFAPAFELPLTLTTLFSPVFLPSLNLMLDIPALALGLSGVVLFLHASDRIARTEARGPSPAYALALAAGVLVALAAQTKYTGILALGVMTLHAFCFGRLRLLLVAGTTAIGLFVGWETFLALRYGESHFLLHLRANHANAFEKLAFVFPLPSLIGGVGSGLLVLALAAFGASRRTVLAAIALISAAFGIVAAVPESAATLRPGAALDPNASYREALTLGLIVFAALGLATLFLLGRAAFRLARSPNDFAGTDRRADRFVAAWLLLEIAGYFALSPFPAARRVMGIVIAGTLLLGRLAMRPLDARGVRRRLFMAAAFNAALGTLYFAVDFREAVAVRRAVALAAAWIRANASPSSQAYFVGHWAVHFYARQAGMIPAVDRQFYTRTLHRAGDFLVVPFRRITQQIFWLDEQRSEARHVIALHDRLPLRTLHCFYLGFVPLERNDEPRMQLTIYRFTQDSPLRPYRGHDKAGATPP
jgi:hypothetical protein